jgi:MFS family permease
VYLCATTALIQAVYAAVRMMISYRALELGGNATTVGVLIALYSLVPLAAALPIGRAVDGHHTSRVLRLGTLLAALAVVIIAVSPGLTALAIGSVLLGFSNILTVVASQGYIPTRSQPQHYDRHFGGLTVWVAVGQSIGIPVVGLLASETPPDSIDTGGALAAMVGVAIVSAAISLCPVLRIRQSGSDIRLKRDRQSTATMLRTPGMRPAVFSSLIVLTSMDLMSAYMPVFGSAQGYSVAAVTAILTARSVASIASRLLITRLLQIAPRSWLLVSGSLCSALPILLVPLASNALIVGICLAIAGLFWGLAQPLTMTWVAGLVNPANRASALSLRLTGNRLGQVAIPLAAGALAGTAGTAAVFVLAGGLLVAAAASTYHALFRHR